MAKGEDVRADDTDQSFIAKSEGVGVEEGDVERGDQIHRRRLNLIVNCQMRRGTQEP